MGTLVNDINFEKVNHIRKDPKSFFSKYDYSEDTYYLDILKELCEESLDVTSKIHLLSLLEQNAEILLGSPDEIEQTAGSLLGIYHSTPDQESNKPGRTLLVTYKGRILSTLTSVLLARQNESDSEMLFSDLVGQLKDILLETALSHRWPSLRTTACVCLNEMEAFFPGVLAQNRDQILEVCQQTHSLSWLSLLALCLENDLRTSHQLRKKEKFRFYAPVERLNAADQSNVLDYLVKQTVTNTTSYPPHVFYALLSSLQTCMELEPRCAKDLEVLAPHLTSSMDFLLLQLALRMLDPAMMDQLIRLPSLMSLNNRSSQLLCLEWLASYLTHHQEEYDMEQLLSYLAFSPFEGPDTHEKKLRILSSIPPLSTDASSAAASTKLEIRKKQMILQGLQLLERSSSSAKKTTRPIGSLFRSLAFHLASPQENLIRELDMLISGRVLPFVLSPDHSAELRSKLWLHCLDLAQRTLSRTQSAQVNQMFLSHLHQLVNRGESSQNAEHFLAVIRTILAHQHFQDFKEDLEYLLFQFGTKTPNTCPVSVGRSKLFFTALGQLPPSRLQKHLCISTSPAPKYKSPYLPLTDPLFTIHRHPSKFLVTNEDQLPAFSPAANIGGEDLAQSYMSHLADLQPALSLTYQLKPTSKLCGKTDPLFAVVISLEGKPASRNKIKDFIIPCLQPQKSTGPWEPTFLVYPQSPRPLSLHCRCRFSLSGSEDVAGTIGSDLLPFDSLFLRLPTDHPRELFTALWDLYSAGNTPDHLVATQMINKPWQTTLPQADHLWHKFSIPTGEEEGRRDYGILLACGSHLLLRLQPAVDPGRTSLAVGADHPDTLGCFHNYLSSTLVT